MKASSRMFTNCKLKKNQNKNDPRNVFDTHRFHFRKDTHRPTQDERAMNL